MSQISPNESIERSPVVEDGGLRAASVDDSVVQAFAALTPEQFAAIMANRVFIERAKGLLMAVYTIDADHAFEMLRRRSQETNVKLRSLARQLVQEFPTLTDAQRLPTPEGYDHVLNTAHERVPTKRK